METNDVGVNMEINNFRFTIEIKCDEISDDVHNVINVCDDVSIFRSNDNIIILLEFTGTSKEYKRVTKLINNLPV